MAVTFLFSAVAVIAFVPVGVLLFLILDRYAEPNVPKSLFDERKVMLTFVVGIALGLVLSVIFVAYAYYLHAGAVPGAVLVALVFLIATALLRRIFVSTRTFGGVGGSDPLLPVHTLSVGAVSGGTIALGLGLDIFANYPNSGWTALVELTGISIDMMLVEAWAGLRFGREMRKGFSWTPPLGIMFAEGLLLLTVAPLFIPGAALFGYVGLPILGVGAAWYLYREEPRALKALRRAVGVEAERRQGRFGRGREPAEGAAPTGEIPGDLSPTSPPGDSPPLPP